jgi:site-specific DNA-methyltransferase (adenine-specific)
VRIEVIGRATLILGDCREVLPQLGEIERSTWPAMLLTDPPYRVTSGGKNKTGDAPRGGWLDDYSNDGEIVATIPWDEWLPLAFDAMGEPSHAYVFTNDRNEADARIAALAAGFDFHRLLVWDKKTALPNRWYQQTCEFVLFLKKGKAFRINDPSSKALVTMAQVDESGTATARPHPTEKPVDLCEHYVRNSTSAGALVLDPFMGSGTSGVAAIRAGRAFIGIEIDEKWFDAACRRIAATAEQPRLFADGQ